MGLELLGDGLEQILLYFELPLDVLKGVLVVEYLGGSVDDHSLSAHVGYFEQDVAHF